MNPPEHQGEGDRDREQAAPEEQLVHPPARAGSLEDERLPEQVGRQVAAENHWRCEKLPFRRINSNCARRKRRVGGLFNQIA